MTERELLSEELLDVWLSASLSIINERLVSAMTFNESMVCNLLYRQEKKRGAPLTATDLCGRLQILKPQMNVILNHLERDGMISRTRSRTDRRSVHILLTEKGTAVYERAHREILRFPDGLIERLGEKKIRKFTRTMKEVLACFVRMKEEMAAQDGAGGRDLSEAKGEADGAIWAKSGEEKKDGESGQEAGAVWADGTDKENQTETGGNRNET